MNLSRLRIPIFLAILLSISCSNSHGFPGDSLALPIADIKIFGNDHTRTPVILREMMLQTGDAYDADAVEADRRRIYNLGLFTRVEVYPVPADSGMVLLIDVSERWYIWPYPIFFIGDRDWKNLSYGGGLLHANFRGWNEQLQGRGWLGYNPSLRFSYQTPWFLNRANQRMSINLYHDHVIGKTSLNQDYSEIHRGIGVGVGRRLGYFFFVDGLVGYSSVQSSNSEVIITDSATGKDTAPYFNLAATYDNRDLAEYPRAGALVMLSVFRSGLRESIPRFWRYAVDARKYVPLLRPVSLALRMKYARSLHRVPIYRRLHLGYAERVRGHFYDKAEGDNLLLGSIALRFWLMKTRYIPMPEMGSLHQFMRYAKLGLKATIFADAGRVWFPGEKWSFRDMMRGFGVGLNLQLPFVNFVRLEMAFDEGRRSEFIFDSGVAF